MSTKSNQSISQKTAKLDELVAWFDSDDFDLELALEKFSEAKKLADEIERDLSGLKNNINVIAEQFDKEKQ